MIAFLRKSVWNVLLMVKFCCQQLDFFLGKLITAVGQTANFTTLQSFLSLLAEDVPNVNGHSACRARGLDL